MPSLEKLVPQCCIRMRSLQFQLKNYVSHRCPVPLDYPVKKGLIGGSTSTTYKSWLLFLRFLRRCFCSQMHRRWGRELISRIFLSRVHCPRKENAFTQSARDACHSSGSLRLPRYLTVNQQQCFSGSLHKQARSYSTCIAIPVPSCQNNSSSMNLVACYIPGPQNVAVDHSVIRAS